MLFFIITKENIEENFIKITEKADVNHLKNAFRVKIGENIRAVDGEREYICVIKEISKKEVILSIEEIFEDRYSPNIKVSAGIGILKNDKMDMVIQKLTEIGVEKIIPIKTKRGVVKLDSKKQRWDTLVKEALKQCQGVRFTDIDEVVELDKIDFKNFDLVLVPYECEDEKSLKNILDESLEKNSEIKNILYIIGPEGGFEKEEIDYLEDCGARIVSLGRRILRAETAAIVVGGILINEFW